MLNRDEALANREKGCGNTTNPIGQSNRYLGCCPRLLSQLLEFTKPGLSLRGQLVLSMLFDDKLVNSIAVSTTFFLLNVQVVDENFATSSRFEGAFRLPILDIFGSLIAPKAVHDALEFGNCLCEILLREVHLTQHESSSRGNFISIVRSDFVVVRHRLDSLALILLAEAKLYNAVGK